MTAATRTPVVRFLTVREVAATLRTDPGTVRHLIRAGELAGFKGGTGGRTSAYLCRAEALEKFVAAREAAQARINA